jgi:diacylglycerol kinase family enzyme
VIGLRHTEYERSRSRASGIGLIINVQAHGNQHAPDQPHLLADLIGKHDRVATTRSLEELQEACRKLAWDRPDIVAICGGDGTLHQTLTALVQAYASEPLPKIAILRGGAMNIVAESLGIRGEPVELLRKLLDLKRRRAAPVLESFEHGLLHVNDRYGFMFGAGVIHDFLKAYYATGKPSAVTAARLLVRAAASTLVGGDLSKQLYRPLHARVVADGMRWPRVRFVAVCAATIEQIGFGFRPFYRCGERADGFAVLGIDTTHLGLLRELPRIKAGKPIRRSKVSDDVAHEVTLTPMDPDQLGYTIDGDLYSSDRTLTITRGPTLDIVRL